MIAPYLPLLLLPVFALLVLCSPRCFLACQGFDTKKKLPAAKTGSGGNGGGATGRGSGSDDQEREKKTDDQEASSTAISLTALESE